VDSQRLYWLDPTLTVAGSPQQSRFRCNIYWQEFDQNAGTVPGLLISTLQQTHLTTATARPLGTEPVCAKLRTRVRRGGNTRKKERNYWFKNGSIPSSSTRRRSLSESLFCLISSLFRRMRHSRRLLHALAPCHAILLAVYRPA